jgi:hypothetical protein
VESTQQSATCTEASRAPLHTVRETLRSVALPTATLGGPGSIAYAAAQTQHLRKDGDRNPTGYDFDAAGQLVPKAGAR